MKLGSMLAQYIGHQRGLGRIRESSEPKQDNAGVRESLTDYQLTEVLVGGQEQRRAIIGVL